MTLDVGYDATAATVGRTGVARYARELVAAVGQYDVRPHLFAVGRGVFPPPPATRRVRVPLRPAQRIARVLRAPRAEWLVGDVDLVHVLDMTPWPTSRPLALTVHDVAALEHPEWHHPRQVAQQRAQLAAAARADLVCAVSRATSDALVRRGVPAERIVVTPLGLTRPAAPEPVDIGAPFVLAVGEVTARKGLDTLVDAFAAARLPSTWRLVLAGPVGHGADRVVAGGGDRVVVLGPVSDGQLAGLYAEASALAAPSRAEGFGLPVLEAMGAGLPVIASDLDVVREVAGDAAVLVPVDDVAAWRSALERLGDEPDGLRRLRDAGRSRAAMFTWARTAQLTVEAYHRMLGCR